MASQCNILSDGDAADAKKYHDALLHAEKHIDKLDRHLDLMEKDAINHERMLQIQKEEVLVLKRRRVERLVFSNESSV